MAARGQGELPAQSRRTTVRISSERSDGAGGRDGVGRPDPAGVGLDGRAAAFAEAGLVSVAWNERQLPHALEHLQDIAAPTRAGSHASVRLLTALHQFIHGDSEQSA